MSSNCQIVPSTVVFKMRGNADSNSLGENERGFVKGFWIENAESSRCRVAGVAPLYTSDDVQ